jgi:hypothetical protein
MSLHVWKETSNAENNGGKSYKADGMSGYLSLQARVACFHYLFAIDGSIDK